MGVPLMWPPLSFNAQDGSQSCRSHPVLQRVSEAYRMLLFNVTMLLQENLVRAAYNGIMRLFSEISEKPSIEQRVAVY